MAHSKEIITISIGKHGKKYFYMLPIPKVIVCGAEAPDDGKREFLEWFFREGYTRACANKYIGYKMGVAIEYTMDELLFLFEKSKTLPSAPSPLKNRP